MAAVKKSELAVAEYLACKGALVNPYGSSSQDKLCNEMSQALCSAICSAIIYQGLVVKVVRYS